jgi:hypothetical protein
MSFNPRRVDVGWWLDQIQAGIEFRKKYAMQERWTDWRAYYRGEWASDVLPLNFFFMLMRALVPRVYFRNPAVSISPAKPGILNAIFAQLQERIDNKLLNSMKVKKQIKKMVQDAFLYGTADGKLGFGAVYSPSPEGDSTEAPLTRIGRVEYRAGILPNMPWFARVHPKHLIVPLDCEDIDDAMWVAHEVERPLEDVKADPRFKNTDSLRATKTRMVYNERRVHVISKPIEMVTLYEIRDRKWERVIVISPEYTDGVLYEGPDELQTLHSCGHFPLVFNNDDEVFWGVPDSTIIEPQQLEMNEIRTQMMKHRRITLVKILAQEGAISPTEAQKMVDETVGPVVWVKDVNGIRPIQASGVPADLAVSAEYVHADVREQIGFSRNQMGEHIETGGNRTTATEASIVQMASEIRVDERRQIVADLVTDLVQAMHEVIHKFWTEEQVIDVIGPGGVPVWVEFTGEMLKGGQYEVHVDPDTAIPQTRLAREQKALQVYQLLKSNPLIDPIQLTQYLLRELHGVQYDQLMRGLPRGAGLNFPMNVAQYGQLLSNAQRLSLPQPEGGQNAAV